MRLPWPSNFPFDRTAGSLALAAAGQCARSLTKTMRIAVAISLNLAGMLLYAFGLIGLLTPSQGMPSLIVVFVFAGFPVGFLGISLFMSRLLLPRLITSVEIASIAGFTGWLLWLQVLTS